MLDVVDPIHLFHVGILEEDSGHESMMHQDVDVLVDGCGDEETAMVLVVGGDRSVPPPPREMALGTACVMITVAVSGWPTFERLSQHATSF